MSFTIPKMKAVEATVTAVTDLSADKIASLERMQEIVLEIEAERDSLKLDTNEPSDDIFSDE